MASLFRPKTSDPAAQHNGNQRENTIFIDTATFKLVILFMFSKIFDVLRFQFQLTGTVVC